MSRKPQPDLQVGIVHVKSERRLDKILALVSRLATNRVGVSARFDDLHDTPHALHFACSVAFRPATVIAGSGDSVPPCEIEPATRGIDVAPKPFA